MKFILAFILLATQLILPQKGETKIRSMNELGAVDVQLTNSVYCEYPDICINSKSEIFVAFTQYEDGKEKITLYKINNDQVQDSFVVSKESGHEYRPKLFCDKDDKIWITWAAKRNDNWEIYLRSFKEGIFSDEINISNDPGIDMNPAITVDLKNNVWITWESYRNNNFDVYSACYNGTTVEMVIPVSNHPAMELRPQILAGNKNDLYVVWDRQIEDSYTIQLKHFDGKKWNDEITVSPVHGFNLAPSIAFDKKGDLTVAWQSNLQPDGNMGLPRWIYLAKFNGSKLSETYSLAEPKDWIKNGEEQGFEFPELLFDKDGNLMIFGRTSQGFYTQIIKDKKKSDIFKFTVVGWGGRGQNIYPVMAKDGTIFSVRRDIKFIYLNKIPADYSKPLFSNSVNVIQPGKITPIKNDYKLKKRLQLTGGKKIFFGDIHQHSSISDGSGTIDECYTRSRYVYGQDFAALTDHEWFTNNLLIPSEWERIKIIGESFYKPGEFVTIPAYEWTTPRLPAGFGHKNVYFYNWKQPVFSFNENAKNTKELNEHLARCGAIAIPHHLGWSGTDWEAFDVAIQPVVEIVSAHGAFEFMGNEPITHRGGMPGHFIQDGLKKGLKFGFTGSSDGHGLRWHHGVGTKEDEWQTGLTGIIANELTIESVLSALKNRNTFATSGTRIQIHFSINDNLMGSDIEISTSPEIEFEVVGTAPLKYVTIVRDNEDVFYFGKDTREGWGVKKKFVDTDTVEGSHYYYLRAILEDGEVAWSSPIWVNIKK